MTVANSYSISIKKIELDGEEYYRARVSEFPYLEEYAETYSDAYVLLIDAIETSLEVLAAENKSIPLPSDDREIADYSGRVTLRLPKSLHAALSEAAENEDVSLNQLIVSALSDFNGFNRKVMPVHVPSHKTVAVRTARNVTERRQKTEVKATVTPLWSPAQNWALEA